MTVYTLSEKLYIEAVHCPLDSEATKNALPIEVHLNAHGRELVIWIPSDEADRAIQACKTHELVTVEYDDIRPHPAAWIRW